MAITIRLKHWQTALTHHGASLLSCLQTQTQTPSRSLCSLLSPTNSEEDQKRRQNEEQKEMFRMNYKVDATSHDTRQPFKPSVFFYIGNQGHEASVGDFIFTERLKYVDVKDKVEFTKVGLVSLKRKLFLRHPLKRLLQNAYVKAVVEAHVQEFGKVITLIIESGMMYFMPKPAVTTRLSCLDPLYRISKYIYFSSITLIACGQIVVTLTLDGDYSHR